MGVSQLREEYTKSTLDVSDVAANPIDQFRLWFDEALASGLPEPNAMTLSTATPQGKPSARIILLKAFDDRGFTFFTNYESRKGQELAANPFAALTSFYAAMERQVRIEGPVERVSEEESDAYYWSRPPGSRLGAWASNQSRVVPDRLTLDQRLATLEERARTESFPRPPHWGGFRVVPDAIEFWQGRPNRMHDRILYRRVGPSWTIERLEP